MTLAKKGWFAIIKETFSAWSADRASTLAAALSYTAIFALAPIVVVAVFLAGLFLGKHGQSREVVHRQAAAFLGENTANFLDQVIQKTYESTVGHHAIWLTVISSLLLLYAATALFTTLQDSLNLIWHMKRDPKSSWKGLIRDRLVTLVMVLAIGLLLLASVVVSTMLTGAFHFLGNNPWLSRIADIVVSLALFTVLFALLMKFLADAVVPWREVFVGALVTAVLFAIGKYALAFYLTRAAVGSAFGAAGSLIVVLLFVYYSSQIFFLGAEFTKIYARRAGHPIQPSANAVAIDGLGHAASASGAA